jgi:hypothetical protein
MFKNVFAVFWTLVLLMRCISSALMLYSPIFMSLGTCMQWGGQEVLVAVSWTRRSLTVPTLDLTKAPSVPVELFRCIPSIHCTLNGPTFLGVCIHPLVMIIWKLQEFMCRKCTDHRHTPMPLATMAGTEEGDIGQGSIIKDLLWMGLREPWPSNEPSL